MNARSASVSTRPVVAALATGLTAAALTLAIGGTALAQALTPAPKAQPKQQPKAAPQAQPSAQQPQQAQGDQPQLTFSPWTKVCMKGQEANAPEVCVTGKDGRLDTGQPVVAAVLIEPKSEPRKILRVTLPLGMALQQGTRVIVDQGQPITAPYVICLPNGCMADYEASGELIGKLKQGKGLVVQGMNAQLQAVSLVLPLADFAKAYDGPPTDPKVLEERQKKLQEEFQNKNAPGH